jgi:GTPase SAR1 family protein
MFQYIQKTRTPLQRRPISPVSDDDAPEAQGEADSKIGKEQRQEGKFRVKKAKDDKQKLKRNPGCEFVGRHPFRCLLVGESSSGKTTLMLHLLNNFYAPYFDEIWIWSPNFNIDSTWKLNLKFKPTRVFTEFREEDVNELRDQQLAAIEKNGILHAKKVLALLDDFANEWEAMHSRGLERFFTIARHWNVSPAVIVQKYNKVSLTIRTNASILCFFHASNATELEQIRDEQTSQLITKREFVRLFNEATTREKHGFLTVNHQAKPEEIYRFNLALVQPITKSVEELENEERLRRQAQRKKFKHNQDDLSIEGGSGKEK